MDDIITCLIEFRQLARLMSEDEQKLLFVLGECFTFINMWKRRTIKCAVWRGEGGCKFVTHGWFDALYSFNLQFGLGKPPLYWFTRNKHSPHRQMFRHRQVHKQMFDGNTNTIKLSQLSDKHPPYRLMLTNRSNTGFKIPSRHEQAKYHTRSYYEI